MIATQELVVPRSIPITSPETFRLDDEVLRKRLAAFPLEGKIIFTIGFALHDPNEEINKFLGAIVEAD